MLLHLPDKPQTFRPSVSSCSSSRFYVVSSFIQEVLWCAVIFFFYRGTQPHHLSLLSELCVVHIKAYACISCCDAALLLSRCVFSASLYSRYLWMWVWPLMGSFLNSVSWSSALLCSDVVLSSLMRLNWVLSYVSFQLWINYQLSQRFLLSFLQRNWDNWITCCHTVIINWKLMRSISDLLLLRNVWVHIKIFEFWL